VQSSLSLPSELAAGDGVAAAVPRAPVPAPGASVDDVLMGTALEVVVARPTEQRHAPGVRTVEALPGQGVVPPSTHEDQTLHADELNVRVGVGVQVDAGGARADLVDP